MEKKSGKILLALILSAGILSAYSLIEPYLMEVKQIGVESKDIPESFDGKKVVFISDIHYGPFFSKERVRDLVTEVNDLAPDLIVIGGDYVDHSSEDISSCFEELRNLKAPLGVYGVLGNHDHWGRENLTHEKMTEAGITPLDNKAVWISLVGERIKLGGVGDLWHDTQNISPTIDGVGVDDFIVLLSHNPDYAEKIKTDKVDLVLSGHTHDGQVTFFWLWAPYTNSKYGQKYRSGFVDTKYAKVYVTRGIGTTILPIRFFARPEITVLNLKRV